MKIIDLKDRRIECVVISGPAVIYPAGGSKVKIDAPQDTRIRIHHKVAKAEGVAVESGKSR